MLYRFKSQLNQKSKLMRQIEQSINLAAPVGTSVICTAYRMRQVSM
jgi:hypothetical protein